MPDFGKIISWRLKPDNRFVVAYDHFAVFKLDLNGDDSAVRTDFDKFVFRTCHEVSPL